MRFISNIRKKKSSKVLYRTYGSLKIKNVKVKTYSISCKPLLLHVLHDSLTIEVFGSKISPSIVKCLKKGIVQNLYISL